MEIRPDYYDSFKCIAEKCKNNCCIGWEIDIDDDTLKKYKAQQGALGEKLKANISKEPCAHFILGENERCPFLNDENLCELIIEGGEGLLCQICYDHPRFYNDMQGATEKGVGLSCEAAAALILTKSEPFYLISNSGELPQNDFYEQRGKIFSILQDRAKPLVDRISEVLDFVGAYLPADVDWIGLYKKLERLDPIWGEHLDRLSEIKYSIPENLEIAFEQLICYFFYRHLSGALYDFMYTERVQFAVLSCFMISSLCKNKTLDELCDISRMYSAEIEYSDENIEILLEALEKYNEK